MRFIRAAGCGLLLACLPVVTGCATLAPKWNALPSIARHRSEAQYQVARTAEQRGQLEKARDLYAALQKQSPNIPDYAHRMGVVCTQLADHETAGKYFEHALALNPRNPSLLADMGYSAYLQKDYPRAESLLKESVQLRPNDPRAINNLAMSIGFQGRYQECQSTFLRVNSDTQALLNVGFIQSQRGDLDAAVASYQEVLSREPGNKVASSALQQLIPMRSGLETVASNEVPQNPAANDQPPAVVTAQQAWEAEPITSSEPGNPVTDLPSPMIASYNELPPPASNPHSPIITPGFLNWAPTAPHETTKVSAGSDFELPERIAPPAELESDPAEETAVAKPVAPSELTAVPESPAVPENTVVNDSPVATVSEPPQAMDPLLNAFEGDENVPEPVSPGTEDLTGLDWARDELAQDRATAEAGSPSAPESEDCLRGYCPVALRDERRLAKSLDQYTTEFQAQNYRFSSAEARDRFLEHPEWYIPAAGGLDILEVRRGQNVTLGSLDHACWFRHRLHMFSTAENLAAFRATPRDFVANP